MKAAISSSTRRRPKPAAVLAVAGFGAFLAFLDSTIVNVAFPSIQASFPSTSLSTLSWVLNAYNIIFAGFLVAAGRFADLIGRRRMFVIGVLVFTIASAGCAVSTSVSMLIAFRLVQGIGCAILVPASLAMVIEAFPEDKLTEGVTLWGATAALAAGLGPPIGGALVNSGNWRWAFLINIPLGIFALVIAKRVVVESRAPGRRQLPDLPGTGLLIGGITLITLAIVEGHSWGWTGLRVGASVLLGIALLVAFGVRNARHPVPVLDPALLRNRRFAMANLITVITGAGFYAYGLTHILWLRYVWDYSLFKAGLAVAPGALVAAVAAAVLGRVAERHGHRLIIVLGATTWALALIWYATQLGIEPDFLGEWLPGQILSGIGVGATLPIVTSAALVGIQGGRHAAGSAAVSSTRQFGAVLGIAVLVAIIGTPTTATAVDAFRRGWIFSACCFVAGAVLAIFLGRTHGAEAGASPEAVQADAPVPVGAVAVPKAVAASRAVTTGGARSAGEAVAAVPAQDGEDRFFGALPPEGRLALQRALRTVDVPAGGFLFRQGDAPDGMYLVRTGQLEVLIDDNVVSRMGAGDVIGELALLTGAPRSASIRARRDSRLDHLTAQVFDKVVHEEPAVALSLARSVAGRLQELSPPKAPRARPRVVAVTAADRDAPVEKVSAALVAGLGRYLRVTDPGIVDAAGLDRVESAYDRVVLTARFDDSTWREFCLRSADRVVVVAGSATPPPTPIAGEEQDCDLVLTAPHVSRADMIGWFELMNPVSAHRIPDAADVDGGLRALSARLAQRSVGLVLAGGGARSFAQLGVIEELEQAGVIIDRVAGTSAGAIIGSLLATGRSAAEIDAIVYEEFVRNNPLGDYTVPRRGLIRGERTAAAIRRQLGALVFEELPREFHAVSTDIIRRKPVIHSRGSLADAITASLRIPGLFPPLRLGDSVHVDGAVLDNLPVGALDHVPDGPIIAVNIGQGGGGSNRARPVSGPPQPPRIPGMAETMMRTMFMSSGPATAVALERADIVIMPRTGDVGFLEWHQIDVLREAGRRAAAEAMPQILDIVNAGVPARPPGI